MCKSGHRIKIGDKEIKLSAFDTQKSEILKEIRNIKYNDLEDMVYKFQLTNDENIDILELKFIPTKRTGYSLKPKTYQISDINKILKSISPDIVKMSVTVDENILKSNLKINQTSFFTDRSFFILYWV